MNLSFRKSTMSGLLVALMISPAACTDSDTNGAPAGSQGMVSSSNRTALYVATGDDGVVTRVDVATGQAVQTRVEGEPTRAARIGDRVFVTLRTERSLLELIDNNGRLTPGRSISVGAEPVGVVASQDGRLYVAVSLSGRVLELDADSLTTLRIWELPNEPRWLALGGDSLYVAGAWDATLVHINLATGEADRITVRGRHSFNPRRAEPVILTPRFTGDIAVTPDQGSLLVPTLFVDNTSVIPETETEPGVPPPPPEETGYGEKIVPAVMVMPLDSNGVPDATNATAIMMIFEIIDAPTSYISSVAVSPNGQMLAATLEGGSGVAFMDMQTPLAGIGPEFGFFPTRAARVDDGPSALTFIDDDRVYVYNFLSRTVQSITVPSPESLSSGRPIGASVGPSIAVADNRLPAEVENGRRLFYSTEDPSVTDPRIGVSCATCHFEGRNDGLTWNFERGPRQTPSLAGMISLREPVRWDGQKATVADDARDTSRDLMGALDMTQEAAQDIAAFIDYVRDVDNPQASLDNELVARGREIFNRTDTACGTCHSGPIFSDKQLYNMFGLDGVKTPSLLGVVATPPYLHNGSAPTLRAVLEAARSGAMGDTSNLTEAEMDALEAYLKTL